MVQLRHIWQSRQARLRAAGRTRQHSRCTGLSPRARPSRVRTLSAVLGSSASSSVAATLWLWTSHTATPPLLSPEASL